MAPRSCSHCQSIVRSHGRTEVVGKAVDIVAAVPQRRSEVVFAVLAVAGKGDVLMRCEWVVLEVQSC